MHIFGEFTNGNKKKKCKGMHLTLATLLSPRYSNHSMKGTIWSFYGKKSLIIPWQELFGYLIKETILSFHKSSDKHTTISYYFITPPLFTIHTTISKTKNNNDNNSNNNDNNNNV